MGHNSKRLAETAQFIWARVSPQHQKCCTGSPCCDPQNARVSQEDTIKPINTGRGAPASTVPSAGVKIKPINQMTLFPRKKHTQVQKRTDRACKMSCFFTALQIQIRFQRPRQPSLEEKTDLAGVHQCHSNSQLPQTSTRLQTAAARPQGWAGHSGQGTEIWRK